MTENVLAYLLETKGQAYVMNLLGLNKQQQNPKYAISLGGKSFNPINMLKRAGVNKMFSSGSSMGGLGSFGGAALMGGAALGLGYLTNPLREGSRNYNPNLQGQIDYASGRGYIGKNPNSGLMQYGPGSVLRGQNVVSGFGTNDYRGQLGKKQSYFEDKINKGKNYNQTQYEKTLNEIKEYEQDQVNKELAEEEKQRNRKTYSPPYQGKVHDSGGGSNNYGGATQSGGFDRGGFEQDGTGRQGYNRGGIASL